MKKFFITLVALFTATFSINAAAPVKVIFDTDMGNDVDDVVALDMFYKYMDESDKKLFHKVVRFVFTQRYYFL